MLSLGKVQKYLAFPSLNLIVLWLRRRYSRSEKFKNIWLFPHLIVSLPSDEEADNDTRTDGEWQD